MEAIMISIKPKWCAKIMNGDKTIEVRKNKALAKAIQKLIDKYGYAEIYVYCSKDGELFYNKITEKWFALKSRNIKKVHRLSNGVVKFKFRCYKVEEIRPKVKLGLLNTYNTYETETLAINPLLEKCCLSYEELDLYLKWKIGYAIHISDLEIFDRPKELREFDRCILTEDLSHDNITHIHQRYKIIKAPQNFCYVEVEVDEL